MKVDNPLSREFLLNYPTEAARVLEQVSNEDVAAFFSELPSQTVIPVLAAMLPEKAAACFGIMVTPTAVKLVTDLPLSTAACIYRLLPRTKQDELSGSLSSKTRNQLRRYMKYPTTSVGAMLDPNVDTLPDTVTVSEAIRRIGRLNHSVNCDIYIVDETHHLVGMIEIGRLFTSSGQAKLRDIMIRKTRSISVHATAETLLTHPGWKLRRSLPVVERDNTLIGVLNYKILRDSIGETDSGSSNDPLENLLSLAALYWISVAQLLASIFSVSEPNKGDRK